MVCAGVFERFPGLRVVLTEGGFGWLPPLMWRLDQAWARLREETPGLRRAPSEVIRERMRISTQPMEEPPNGRQFLQLLDQFGSDDMILFATDYPHWDFDDPMTAFPAPLPERFERKIMAENARAVYRL